MKLDPDIIESMAIGTADGAPQYCFKDGKLLIFTGGEVMLIRGWPAPTAVRKDNGRWIPFWPEFRLVSPYRPARKKADKPAAPQDSPGQMTFDFAAGNAWAKPVGKPTQRSLDAQRRKRALNGFRFSLPKEIARAIEPFCSHQWPLLVLLAHDPTAIDLARSNPALAYAVALHFNGDLQRITATRPGMVKQRDLLAMLGLPPTKSLVNLFQKITPESVNGQNVYPLLSALSNPTDETQKLLAHAPKINYGVMQLVLDARVRHAVTSALLNEVATDRKEKYRPSAAQLLAATLTMDQELGAHIAPDTFASVERLREVHEKVAEAFDTLRRLNQSAGPLPPPPLPGIENAICPIRTQHELMEEGISQHNCVADYGYRVTAGECYIYKVLTPERATLSIERGPDRQWHIGELKGACNVHVHPQTRAYVREWLDRYRFGFGR